MVEKRSEMEQKTSFKSKKLIWLIFREDLMRNNFKTITVVKLIMSNTHSDLHLFNKFFKITHLPVLANSFQKT